MEYTHLGRSGLQVSRLCLGTMNFGPETPEEEAHAIMDHGLELGFNFFDTANVYGWKQGEGVTEQIIGRWFAKGGTRRDRVVLATKLYGSMSDWPNDTFLSARNIVRACEGSLRRLRTDHLDLYQMHHIDRSTPWDEIWQAMETLVTQGKVIYVGSSNFAGWHLAEAQETARARHLYGLASEQSLYNLLKRDVELEVIPAARHYGIGLIPWSPLMGGLLGGILGESERRRRASTRIQRMLAEHREQVRSWEAFCADAGEEPAAMALAWLLHREGVTSPIIGPRTLAQLDDSMRALDIELEDEQLRQLDRIFPGPGGAAPEAYAW